MREFKYNNAIIRISGEVNREKLEESVIKFIRKVDRCRKNKLKEKNQNVKRIS